MPAIHIHIQMPRQPWRPRQGPVDSPEKAVRAAIASEHKSANMKESQ
jgi:hypothetical protein